MHSIVFLSKISIEKFKTIIDGSKIGEEFFLVFASNPMLYFDNFLSFIKIMI
jgi:hypothetical protein